MLNPFRDLVICSRAKVNQVFTSFLPLFILAALNLGSSNLSANPPCVTNEVIQLNLVNAPAGTTIASLTNGYVINKAIIPGSFNVEAITCTGTVGSVKFQVNGSQFRTESLAPYALTGDKGGAFKPWNPAVGSYTITATPYTGSGGSGTAGVPLSVTIQVIDQPVTIDCNGDQNGSASIDSCGICSGGNTGKTPNASCKDCNGVVNGSASVDACGVCSGGNTGVTPDACVDCAGVVNGSAAIDACGECAGGTTGKTPDATCLDCNNVPNGGAVIDSCGDCVLGTTGKSFNGGCNIDCAGVINGTAAIDACGECAGGTTGKVPDQSCTDCNGDVNGTASQDNCGNCAGGNTGIVPDAACTDCNGTLFGSASVDTCGVCAGGTTGITPNSTCGGGGSCTPNEVVTLMLMEAGLGGSALGPINNGDVIIKSVVGPLSIDALVCDDNAVESVVFNFNGSNIRTENVPPYAINGDNATNGFKAWNVPAGTHTLIVTPYSGNKAGGNAGVPKVVTFTVFDVAPLVDCAGDTNGTASVDACGICSGGATGLTPNATCTDCNGDINGSAAQDNCGVCAGGNTGIVPDASCTDCNGDLFGTAAVDACGVCAGGNTGKTPDASCLDCANVPNGGAVIDSCGDCVLGTTGLAFNGGCNIDCAGVVDGSAAVDACGVCAGGSTGITPDASCTDCDGVVNGTASVDACGICSGGTTGLVPDASCSDCNGDPFGTASVDTCGVCSGGNTGIVPNSTCGGSCVPNEVTDLMLVNATTNSDLNPMSNGDTIDLSVLPSFSVRADVCSEPDVESVVFKLGGNVIRTENIAPYTVKGDNNGNYTPWPLSAGTYTLMATPYSGNNAGGNAGVAKTVTFHVVDGPPVSDCNGVVGGSAYVDGCGTCVGGNTGLSPCTPPVGCGEFVEVGGLVVVEVESEPKANSQWYEGSGAVSGLNVPTPSGTSYYMWKQNCVSGTAPNYVYSGCGGTTSGSNANAMTYLINITTPGRYRFQMRSWQPSIKLGSHGASTENNDFWLKLPDGVGIKKKGATEDPIGTSEWVKIYQNSPGGWRWTTNTVDKNPHQVYLDFVTPGTYTVMIAGRSKLMAIDRFVLYRSGNPSGDVAESYATALVRPESSRGACGGAKTAGVVDLNINGSRTGEQTQNHNALGSDDLLNGRTDLNVNAYPNPTTGQLNLEIVPADANAVIELYDATGKIMLRKGQNGEQNAIDLSGFANGLYWVKIKTGEAIRMERIYKN